MTKQIKKAPHQPKPFAMKDKRRVAVPTALNNVFLDVQEGKFTQSFLDNVNAIANYAGSIENADPDIGEFIREMNVDPLEKPSFPGTDADETDKEIWKAQCSDYVKALGNRKKSLH